MLYIILISFECIFSYLDPLSMVIVILGVPATTVYVGGYIAVINDSFLRTAGRVFGVRDGKRDLFPVQSYQVLVTFCKRQKKIGNKKMSVLYAIQPSH